MDMRAPQALHPAPEMEDIQAILEMNPVDYNLLKQDIKKNGIRQALIIYEHDGTDYIIAGFNRWKIALELKLDIVPVEYFQGDKNARRHYAIIENLSRRHITKEQRVLLARHLPAKVQAKIFKQSERQAKRDKAIVKTAAKRAQEDGRDFPTVQDVVEVKQEQRKTTKQKDSDKMSPPPRRRSPAAAPSPETGTPPDPIYAIAEYAKELKTRSADLERMAKKETKSRTAGQLQGEARACNYIAEKLLAILQG